MLKRNTSTPRPRRGGKLALGLLSCAFLFGPSLCAQDSFGGDEMSEEEILRQIREMSEAMGLEGETDDSTSEEAESIGPDWENMSDEELKAELMRSLKAVSEGMETLEAELAEASLPQRKTDERHAELQAVIEQLKNGTAKRIPEGMLKYFEDNPQKLAELLAIETSSEGAEQLLEAYAEGSTELVEMLAESTDKLEALLEDTEALQELIRLQGEVERDLSGAIERQEMLGKRTQSDIDSALEAAYALRRQ